MITEVLKEITTRFEQLEREIAQNGEGHKWSTHSELVNFGKLKDKVGELRRNLGNTEKLKPVVVVELGQFGATLTGREYGRECFDRILEKGTATIELDFGGVASFSSPFADEVVVPIAQMQGGEVTVFHLTAVTRSVLRDVMAEYHIKVNERD